MFIQTLRGTDGDTAILCGLHLTIREKQFHGRNMKLIGHLLEIYVKFNENLAHISFTSMLVSHSSNN